MAHYAATSAFSKNSLYCCKPTAHCDKSCDPVDPKEQLRLRRELRSLCCGEHGLLREVKWQRSVALFE